MSKIVLSFRDSPLELEERVAWLLCDHLASDETVLRSELGAALERISGENHTLAGPPLYESDYMFVLAAIDHIRVSGVAVPESLEALSVLIRGDDDEDAPVR